MKTFIPAVILSVSALAGSALAMSVDLTNLTRNLSFPEPVSEPVTQGQSKPGK